MPRIALALHSTYALEMHTEEETENGDRRMHRVGSTYQADSLLAMDTPISQVTVKPL